LEETEAILNIIVSWPAVAIIAVLVLRSPIKILIERLIKSESGKAKVGPVEIELGNLAKEGKEAVHNLNQINLLMAESRLLELEITEGNFGPVFSDEQRERMKDHIIKLRRLTEEAANKAN
jgi:hypothetical protein